MNTPRTGVDGRGRQVFTATTRHDSGRIAIVRLESFEIGATDASAWSDAGDIALAVPDRLATTKPVRLEPGDEATREERLRFELVQSLLEDEGAFIFGSQATGDNLRPLGIVFRRETADRLCASYGCDIADYGERLSLQVRAIGLGRGYLTFCHQVEGELTCLVDLAGAAASICFIRGSNIVETASLATTRHDLTSESGREQFSIDLRTVVNFKQAALREAGIGLPLSNLLLSGDGVDDDFRRTVRTYFPVGVGLPRLNEGFLGGLDDVDTGALPLYLAALGATVY